MKPSKFVNEAINRLGLVPQSFRETRPRGAPPIFGSVVAGLVKD